MNMAFLLQANRRKFSSLHRVATLSFDIVRARSWVEELIIGSPYADKKVESYSLGKKSSLVNSGGNSPS